MTDELAKQRLKRYRESQRLRGYVQARIWVPKERVRDLIAYARKLRNGEK